MSRAALVGDRGSGTIWMLALIALTWSVAAMAMTVGGVRVARHRAYAAADLAALAAASLSAVGLRRACLLAARIARTSGGRLSRCALRGRGQMSQSRNIREFGYDRHLRHSTAQARAG